jgi:serine O-acetyltransferase
MSGFRALVRADIARCLNDQPYTAWQLLGALRRELGLKALLVYRFGRLLRLARSHVLLWPLLVLGWPLYAVAQFLIRRAYGIHLALSADIGPGCLVRHFGGIEVINCTLGARCSVGQLTRVGRAGELQGPRIGNGVWVGAHAQVWGPVQIHDGATIAPGARVSRSVPAHGLVVGDPGRVVAGYDNSPILPAHLSLERKLSEPDPRASS